MDDTITTMRHAKKNKKQLDLDLEAGWVIIMSFYAYHISIRRLDDEVNTTKHRELPHLSTNNTTMQIYHHAPRKCWMLTITIIWRLTGEANSNPNSVCHHTTHNLKLGGWKHRPQNAYAHRRLLGTDRRYHRPQRTSTTAYTITTHQWQWCHHNFSPQHTNTKCQYSTTVLTHMPRSDATPPQHQHKNKPLLWEVVNAPQLVDMVTHHLSLNLSLRVAGWKISTQNTTWQATFEH